MKLSMNLLVFEYDVRGLLMAFYPGEEITTGEDAAGKGISVLYGTGDPVPCRISFFSPGGREDAEVLLDLADRSRAKTDLKRVLYGILSRDTGKQLPWGTLTGIRPTKIPMAMLREGKTDPEILAHMEETLLVSPEKAELALQIAKRELQLLDRIDYEDGISLYIGIPFCPTTCLYCSFTSYPISRYEALLPEYLSALKKEIRWAGSRFRGKKLNTIYFGGGTPTTLPAPLMDELLREVEDTFDLTGLLEWTVEAGRPDSVTEEKFRVLRDHPVSRISINPQTMHQRTLDLIGRRHTVEDVKRAYAEARSLGFDNINMDLILGLPGEGAKDVEDTMREIVRLAPDNVTVHSLAVKRAARLNIMKDAYQGYTMDTTDDVMRMCASYLREINEAPYYLYRQKNMAGNLENTGFARPGTEGFYNILIMEEVQTIVALGAGATTKRVQGDLITRAENVKNVDIYIQNIDEMLRRKEQLFS